MEEFQRKPAHRYGKELINHKCTGEKRRQFQVGCFNRKCQSPHTGPCIIELRNRESDKP
eukprot:UN07726